MKWHLSSHNRWELDYSFQLSTKLQYSSQICMKLARFCSNVHEVWYPWSWGRASTLQSLGPEFESRERVSTSGFFIGPHIRREYWCSSQEAESREISINCKNLFLNRCKINMIKLNNVHEVCINPFPNKPWFLRVCSTSLLKTQWEKEKLLVTSNFSFSHSVFYPV